MNSKHSSCGFWAARLKRPSSRDCTSIRASRAEKVKFPLFRTLYHIINSWVLCIALFGIKYACNVCMHVLYNFMCVCVITNITKLVLLVLLLLLLLKKNWLNFELDCFKFQPTQMFQPWLKAFLHVSWEFTIEIWMFDWFSVSVNYKLIFWKFCNCVRWHDDVDFALSLSVTLYYPVLLLSLYNSRDVAWTRSWSKFDSSLMWANDKR